MARPEGRFRQSITFATVSTRDAVGRPLTFSAQTTAAARVQSSKAFVRDAAGESVLTAYCVYTQAAITLQHRLWLPGDNTAAATQSRRVLKVDDLTDGEGVVAFRKVWL